MKIFNKGESGTPFSLKATREMIIRDHLYSTLCVEKFSTHLKWLQQLLGNDYMSFYKQLSGKYKYVHEYPQFLLDEYVEPTLLTDHPEVIHMLIDNWLYNKPLGQEHNTSQIQMSEMCRRLKDLIQENGIRHEN